MTVESIFAASTPGSTSNDANSPRVFGVNFKAAVAGSVGAIRYYVPGTTRPNQIVVGLWDPSVSIVTPITTATLTGPALGWNSIAITPQSLTIGHAYTASAYITLSATSTQPDYGFTGSALASDVVVGDLTAIAHTGSFHNNAGSSAQYPDSTGDFNFFVDVEFTPSGAATPGVWGVHR